MNRKASAKISISEKPTPGFLVKIYEILMVSIHLFLPLIV
jgi:hypothetical protein